MDHDNFIGKDDAKSDYMTVDDDLLKGPGDDVLEPSAPVAALTLDAPGPTPRRINKTVALLGVTFSSFCVLMASTKFYPNANSWESYATASGVFGTAIGGGLLVLNRLNPTVASGPLMVVAAVLLTIYWVIGAILMTFDQPFSPLGNGYIACYASAFFSINLLIEVLPQARKERAFEAIDGVYENFASTDLNKRWLGLCALGSLIELIEASILADRCCGNGRTAELVSYAVSVGVISLVACAILPISRVPENVRAIVTLFLAAWWTAALAALTFSSSTFNITVMNGYLGTWAAAIASYGMAIQSVAALGFWTPQGSATEYDEVADLSGQGHDAEDYEEYDQNSYASGTGGVV